MNVPKSCLLVNEVVASLVFWYNLFLALRDQAKGKYCKGNFELFSNYQLKINFHECWGYDKFEILLG